MPRSDQVGAPLRVLLVVDDLQWAIGEIARSLKDCLAGDTSIEIQVVEGSEAVRSPLTFFRKCRDAHLIHWLCTYSISNWSSRLLSQKSIATVHHVENNGEDEEWARKAAVLAPVIVVIDGKTEVWARNAFPEKRVVSLCTGYRAASFYPADHLQRERSRSKLGIGEETAAICWVGNALRRNKQLELFREVVGDVHVFVPVHLLVAGKGWSEELLEAFGVPYSRVQEGSPIEDLREVYQVADVLVCTSSIEGGPLPVAEALGCGTPVVSTDVGQVRNWLSNVPGGGKICPPSASALTSGLLHVLGDGAGRPSREQVASGAASAISWEAISPQWQALWVDVASRCDAKSGRIRVGHYLLLAKAVGTAVRVRFVRLVRTGRSIVMASIAKDPHPRLT